MKTRPARQSGATLLEVLVALLIFAFGVLGLLGMQAVAIKLTADAKYRAEASAFADQLISQMWADDRATLASHYQTGMDKYNAWKDQIIASGGLPGASLPTNAPTVTISPENVVTITLRWQAPDEKAPHQHVVVARLN
ncbi:MAG: type IV pilus modification protein PilV [Rhodocyclaceae bacterium]|nr:type IV pilus modification protein PilV [Rhodocyclaceae bacterium]